ncbi:MAG: hypothetical protein EAZ62_01905, partial [Sphingobacteriia bacterium]
LVKNSITDFEKQYHHRLQLSKDNKTYQINLSDFKQLGSDQTIEAKDLTAVVFSFESREGKTIQLDGSLSQVAFTKQEGNPAAIEIQTGEINVYPNPVSGNRFMAQIKSPIQTQVTLRLTDAASGKVLFNREIALSKGTNNVPVQWNSGVAMSIVLLTADGNGIRIQPKKLVIQP